MTKTINTIAEIPMTCGTCAWTGNNAECGVPKKGDRVRGKIIGICPLCSQIAGQSDVCEYQFPGYERSRR